MFLGAETENDNIDLYLGNQVAEPQFLAEVDSHADATLSPDGTQVAISEAQCIRLMPAQPGGVVQDLFCTPDRILSPAQWHPGGQNLIFVQGNDTIRKVDLDGNVTTLVDWPGIYDADFRRPTYSPDGGKIAFSSWVRPDGSIDGGSEVYVSDADGANPIEVSGLNGGFDPRFSPDGSTIAYTGYEEGADDAAVALVSADGIQLQFYESNNGIDEYEPEWSPDGDVYASAPDDESGGWGTHRFNPSIGEPVPILPHWYWVEGLSFRPYMAAPLDFEALAEKYRPILRFDTDERWRPLNVDSFLSESFPTVPVDGLPDVGLPIEHHLACAGPRDSASCFPIESAADLTNDYEWIDVHGEQDSSYSMPGCLGATLLDCHADNTAIYQRHVLSSAYVLLDYWFFYRRDSGYSGIGDHEGDWEGMTVAVPSGDATGTFDWASMSAHGTSWRYLRSVLRCDVGGDGSCGDSGSPTGERVWSYVSNGKHATYPRDCDSTGVAVCGQESGAPEGGFDGQVAWERNDYPESLIELPLNEVSWLAFQGQWGKTTASTLGSGSPGGPTTQDRWETAGDPSDTNREDFNGFLDLPIALAAARNRCGPWFGPMVAAITCDPGRLREALAAGQVQGEPTARLASNQSSAVAGSGTGIAQVLGDPLTVGDTLTLEGLDIGSRLLIRFSESGQVKEAAFTDLPVLSGGRARVRLERTLTGGFRPVLTFANGARVLPGQVTQTALDYLR